MESAVVELNQQSDSSLASKSTRQQVPTDLVPLSNPSDEEPKEVTFNCTNFSIRGYVSEVRKRDIKLCYPFHLKDSAEPLSIDLPPMEVPKSRWWRCAGCVPEASVFGAADNKEPEEYADGPLLLVGQSSKVNVPRVQNAEGSTSSESNDNRDCSPLNVMADPKGKGKSHVEDEPPAPSAWENGFLKDSNKGILQQTTGEIEVSLAAGCEVEIGSRCHGNGAIIDVQKDSRVDGIKAGPAQNYVNHNGEYANENCLEKQQASSEDWHADEPTNGMGADVVALIDGPSNSRKSHLVNLPDLNECSGEPLYDENSEAMITDSNNDVFSEDDDDYLGAERRKNPKVRLLSELLGLTETQSSVKGKKKNSSLTSSLDENVKRKKVGSQNEVSKSIEMRVSHNGTKKIIETTDISQSDSEYASDSDDVSMEIISKFPKRRCKSKVPSLEKRNKKTKFDNSGSSSMSRQRSAGHEKARKSNVSDQLIERSSVLTKKRGKAFQARKEGASFTPCKNQTPKDFAATQKDEDAEKSPAQKVQKASENVHHLPGSHLTKSHCQVLVPAGEDRLCPPSSQAEPMLVDGSSVRAHLENRDNLGEVSVAFRTTSAGTPFTGNPFDGNEERSIGVKTFLKEKKARIPEAEEGGPLGLDTRLQVSNSVVNQKESTNEVRGRMHDIDINSIPADDKVTEQGTPDDIPMDIVELMAKNQYERHLGDAQEKLNYLSTPGIPGRYIRDSGINGSYGERWQKFGQSHFPSIQTPPTTDPRNCLVNGNLGQFSDFNYNSLGVTNCLPRENPVSARFLSLSQGQEHSLPNPPCDLALNNWNGTINMAPAQRYPSSFVHPVESYRMPTCAPRQNTTDTSRVWPSVVASRMPLGITNPQMISQSSNVLNKGKLHYQPSGSMLNFNAPAATNLEKQQNLNFSNGYKVAGHPESSGGSVDMYTNDAISAMHLLSLMQNAAKMQNAALSLGPPKVVGPTSSWQPVIESNRRTLTMQDNSRHPCYPTAIPTARPFASSFQSDGPNIGRSNSTGFVGPIPLTLLGQRNMESSRFALQGGDQPPQRSQMGSSLAKGKNISAISHPSYVNPLLGKKDAVPNFLSGEGVRREDRIITPTPEKEICQLNQNPSEFNDLNVLSRYMIGPEDLKPRGAARDKSVRPRGDAKRQAIRLNRPIPSGKEHVRHRKS